MNVIKFNEFYEKIHGQYKARLTEVQVIETVGLNKDFIAYDTDGKFELKEDKYIYCLFVGEKGIPFTTLRSIEKLEKYVNLVGTVFQIRYMQSKGR